MKKSITLTFLIVIIVCIVMSSCMDQRINNSASSITECENVTDAEQSHNAETTDTVYQTTDNVTEETAAPPEAAYNIANLDYFNDAAEIIHNQNKKDRQETILGMQFDLVYTRTLYFRYENIYFDEYAGQNEDYYILILYNNKNDKISSCSILPENDKRDFKSPLSENPDRQQIIDYAKNTLESLTGASLDLYSVEISTYIDNTTYPYTAEDLEQDYLNFSEYDENFSAEYTVTFYKKICDIHRGDHFYVTMKNNGEILEICCNDQEEEYSLFSDVTADAKDLERAFAQALQSSTAGYDVISSDIKIITKIYNGDLYAVAHTSFSYNSYDNTVLESGHIYAINLTGNEPQRFFDNQNPEDSSWLFPA